MTKISKPAMNDEEARIAKGIAQDPDTMEMSDEQFAEALANKRKRGRPAGSVAEVRKEQVSIRLDPDVLESLRATGPGWQSRVNEMLRDALSATTRKRRA